MSIESPSVEIEGRTVYFNDFQTWPVLWCDAIEKTFPFESEVDFGTVIAEATLHSSTATMPIDEHGHVMSVELAKPRIESRWLLIVTWRDTAMFVETEAYIEGSLWAQPEPVDVG